MPESKSKAAKTWQPILHELPDAKLPEEIEALADRLAENIHDVWGAKRIAEGWSYGPTRSDELKQTPNLVPYEDLTEAEKSYDRAVALETLRSIISLGFEIRPAGNVQ